jgi:hypothetical protein
MSATEPTTYTCTASDIELYDLVSTDRTTLKNTGKYDNFPTRVRELLIGGANPNAPVSIEGPNILIACVNHCDGVFDMRLAAFLIYHGADITGTYQDKTAVEWIGYAHDRKRGWAIISQADRVPERMYQIRLQRLIDTATKDRVRTHLTRDCNKKPKLAHMY